jgi:hypothetical protein
MGHFNRIAEVTRSIRIARVQFVAELLCVDMDVVFEGYMDVYA